ncbi:hypothetical protein CMI47_00475 [Candidatus Pacearchaeota archaeon]|nr:hypothetical protein [Candidatus Pacearchaeota archaeon]
MFIVTNAKVFKSRILGGIMNYNLKDRHGKVIEQFSTNRPYRRITLGELREAKREMRTVPTRQVISPPLSGESLQRIYDDFEREEQEDMQPQSGNRSYIGRFLKWCNIFRTS